MDGDLYDEFGNYIGPELEDSDDSEEEREVESEKDEVAFKYLIYQLMKSFVILARSRRWR